MLCFLFIFSILVYSLYKFSTYKDAKSIFGVYKQKSKWFYFKYILFIFILKLKILMNNLKKQSVLDLKVLDGPQPLLNHVKGFDAVFFIGANKEGFYFTIGTERRHNGIINGLFYLVVPGKGLLCSPKLPDTVLFGAKDNQFGAEGILITPVKAMEKWRLRYKGLMWLKSDPSLVFSVNFTAEWSSKFPFFNYDTDLHPKTVATAMAKETWTKQYFETLKSAHQSRYEQMGEANVKLDIDTIRTEFACQSFRDHGFGGKRDWSLMHRYAFFHIFLDNGGMAAIGVVSQPCTVSQMVTGFLQDGTGTIHSVEWCDLELYQHGEGGRPPKDLAFQFKAGGNIYRVQVTVLYENTHYVGWDWEAKMVERFVHYSVNGISGRGVSEFHYRYREGRPDKFNIKDPEWFKTLRQQYIYS